MTRKDGILAAIGFACIAFTAVAFFTSDEYKHPAPVAAPVAVQPVDPNRVLTDRLNAEADRKRATEDYNNCGEFGKAYGGCAAVHELAQQLKNANRVEECLNAGHSRTYCNQQ